jgi:hypothetical protein
MKKKMIGLVLAGVTMGVVGGFLGNYSGAWSQMAIEGKLTEWGECPASLGLIIRSVLEVLASSVGSAIGICAVASLKGSCRLCVKVLGYTTLGSIAGWIVSYPFSPILWILIPAVFATAAGARAFKLKHGDVN